MEFVNIFFSVAVALTTFITFITSAIILIINLGDLFGGIGSVKHKLLKVIISLFLLILSCSVIVYAVNQPDKKIDKVEQSR